MVRLKKWSKMSLKMKWVTLIRLFTSVFVIINVLLGLFNIINIQITNNINMPLLGIIFIMNGIDSMKDNRTIAIFSFAVAIFSFAVGIFIYTVRFNG